ncbi:hypothetical protein DFQ30_010056 [Apophysomyces sp. BC1015]|nr:hypothetical protein DFQ30_010056 [Apophysomyces sp. BC1015]
MKDDEFSIRLAKLKDEKTDPVPDDEELVHRFTTAFATQPIAALPKVSYHVPDNAYNEDYVEQLLMDADLLNDSDCDDSSTLPYVSMLEDTFVGKEELHLEEEGSSLMRQIQDEVALEAKYQDFAKKRDQDLERRYLALKDDNCNLTKCSTPEQKLHGQIPSPMQLDEVYNEMDSICNEDAIYFCEDCDDRFCNECFIEGHQSETADYEASKHKAKRLNI